MVYSPQILENYRKQSGEGLSVSFVTIWLIGDICNLTGAVMANLIPTIVILGSYVRHFWCPGTSYEMTESFFDWPRSTPSAT